MKTKGLMPAVAMLLLSAVMLTTASFAWFSMNTSVNVAGFKMEAVSDALFLEISDDKNGGYGASANMGYTDEESLRLVTLGHLTSGGMIISEQEVPLGKRYSTADRTDYYMKVVTDSERNDTYEGDNYIKINDKLRDASSVNGYYNFDSGNISFSVVSDHTLSFDGTGSYYKKVGNNYIKLTVDNGDEDHETNELFAGETLRGMYTVTLGAPEDADSRYDGSSLYYEVDRLTGNISPVGSLSLGTQLDGYYTIRETSMGVSMADGDSKYYLKNDRGDYVCIGVPARGVNLNDYYYWARAYSRSMNEVQSENTLNVIKEDKFDNYYLQDTMYFRIASPDKHGENLRVSSVQISGNDSLTDAIRLYFEATDGAGKVARAIYNNRTKTVKYLDGDSLAENILSNSREIISVDVYIYYEGTDEAAKTQNVRLSGQAVSISFEVDYPEYEH